MMPMAINQQPATRVKAADNDDHTGEHLPTPTRQVVEGQRGGEQGYPAE